MIELVIEERCVQCNLCVKVCPLNVFEQRENEPPVIARQDECQTCYMCELYCPAQALYVAADAEEKTDVSVDELTAAGLIGSYRKHVGWEKGYQPNASQDPAYRFYLR